MAAEFFAYGVGTGGVIVNDTHQTSSFRFASQLVIDAGVVSSEGAYADDGYRNQVLALQRALLASRERK